MPVEVLDDFVQFFATRGGNKSEDKAVASHTEAEVAALVHEDMLHRAGRVIVTRAHRTTVFLSLLLGVTVFVPFSTYVLGKYPTMHASTFLYGLTLTCAAIAFNLLIMHFERSSAFRSSVSKRTVRETIFSYRLGLGTYAFATLTSLYKPVLSFALYLLVVARFLLPRGVDSDPARDASSE